MVRAEEEVSMSCGFRACQCTATIGATFFRNHKGACVAPDNCDCPEGERLGDGGSFCEPTCANRSPLCALRSVLKALPQCVCLEGLIRDQTTGRCVPEDQCSGGGNGPAPQPPSQQDCSVDSDCGSRTVICEENVCVQGCLSSNECGSNAVCANGRCINQPRPQPPRPNEPPAPQCEIDVNCQRGFNCQNGRCIPGKWARCNSNGDCLNGWSCNRQNGRCIRQGMLILHFHYKENFASGNCADDSQCDLGQFCSRNTCQDGCRSDNQCPGSQVCRNSNCVDDQPAPCRRGRDCPREPFDEPFRRRFRAV
ncbi:hypothetical protein AAVH_12234 [Aphelenchoides avenae]|nr:hypothetical protein AAVH_12234 [Aphelenchus avenae]